MDDKVYVVIAQPRGTGKLIGRKLISAEEVRNKKWEELCDMLAKENTELQNALRYLQTLGFDPDVMEQYIAWSDENPDAEDIPEFAKVEVEKCFEELKKGALYLRQKAILDHYGYEAPDPAEIAFEHDAIAMSQQESCVEEYQDISQKPTKACGCGHQNDSKPISDRERCLNDAARCVLHDRDRQYGSPEDNFGIIADMWNSYLRNKLEGRLRPHDVAAMMTLMKLARIATGEPKYDNWVDAVGYCACGCEVQGREVMAE